MSKNEKTAKIDQEKIKKEFGDLIGRCTSSKAYLDYCTELYGYRMYLFDMMDRAQLDFILNSIPISRQDTILDLGCGNGSILNYIIKKNHCKGIGIDQLDHEIINKNNGLFTYIEGNIDELEKNNLIPTVTISVDGLYFSNQLERLLNTLVKIKGNRLYLYYSQYIFDEKIEDKSILKYNHTRLAESLENIDIKYKTIDYSENERNLYKKALEILPKYKKALEQEGNQEVYEKKYNENQFGMELYETGCASRYLYIINQ